MISCTLNIQNTGGNAYPVQCIFDTVADMVHHAEEIGRVETYLQSGWTGAHVYSATIDFRCTATEKLFGVLVITKQKTNCHYPFKHYYDFVSNWERLEVFYSDKSLCLYKGLPLGSP